MCIGKIPAGSISETMPMQPYQVNKGNIHFKVKADHRHLNPLSRVHADFRATVLNPSSGVPFTV
jgi:hypothetical protein